MVYLKGFGDILHMSTWMVVFVVILLAGYRVQTERDRVLGLWVWLAGFAVSTVQGLLRSLSSEGVAFSRRAQS